MSAPTASQTQDQTSETPHQTTEAPTQVVQAEPQAESHTETPIAQAAIPQPEGDITIDTAFDDSNSAYSDEL